MFKIRFYKKYLPIFITKRNNKLSKKNIIEVVKMKKLLTSSKT